MPIDRIGITMSVNKQPYKPGDLFWTMNKVRKKGKCPKMQMRWIGPLVVVKRLNNVTYLVKTSEKDSEVIHCDFLNRSWEETFHVGFV